MRLHTYAGSANGYKIELALGQLGRACERVEVDIFAGEGARPAFLALNPAGSVPVLELDDGAAVVESNAILWHVSRGTWLMPEDPLGQTRALSWLCFEQNQVEPVIGSARYWRLTGRDRDRADEYPRRVAQGRRALGVLATHLSQRGFLLGERYSLADIAVYAYAHLAGDIGIDLGEYPAVAAWCARIEGQPGYRPGPAPYGPGARVG